MHTHTHTHTHISSTRTQYTDKSIMTQQHTNRERYSKWTDVQRAHADAHMHMNRWTHRHMCPYLQTQPSPLWLLLLVAHTNNWYISLKDSESTACNVTRKSFSSAKFPSRWNFPEMKKQTTTESCFQLLYSLVKIEKMAQFRITTCCLKEAPPVYLINNSLVNQFNLVPFFFFQNILIFFYPYTPPLSVHTGIVVLVDIYFLEKHILSFYSLLLLSYDK